MRNADNNLSAANSAIPAVLPPGHLASFLLHLLNHHTSPTTLIICSTRHAFLTALLASIREEETTPTTTPPTSSPDTYSKSPTPHPLLQRTLHLLSSSSTIDIAFVTSVPALHAYLSALPSRPHTHPLRGANGSEVPTLAILGILALHRPTPSFSAQGLTRAFAAAVETAYERGQKLVVWEGSMVKEREQGLNDEIMVGMDEHGEEAEGREEETNPWEEDVPILDASTKTFGVMGSERSWLGRSVRVRSVVGRWCRFEEMALGMGENPGDEL